MSRSRFITVVGVVVGAIAATRLFAKPEITVPSVVLLDLFFLLLAGVLLYRIPATLSIGKEFSRLLFGFVLLALFNLLKLFLLQFLSQNVPLTYIDHWNAMLAFLPSLGVAWITIILIRVGGEMWFQIRRRVIIHAVIILFAIIFQANRFFVVLIALEVALYAIPYRWVENIEEKDRSWALLLLLLSPLYAVVALGGISGTIFDILFKEDPVQTIQFTTFTQILRYIIAIFFILLPIRIIVHAFQGGYGFRIPIRVKLAFTYLFSTIIPGILLVAILLVAVFTGIGTLRARAVGELLTTELDRLAALLDDRQLSDMTNSDSVAIGVYREISKNDLFDPKSPDFRNFAIPPDPLSPNPMNQQQLEPSLSITPEEKFFNIMSRIGGGLSTEGNVEGVWVKVKQAPALISMPDTLPHAPGWSDEYQQFRCLLPLQNRRTALGAIRRFPGDNDKVYIALKPLNKSMLDKFRSIIGSDLTIHPNTSFAEDISVGADSDEGISLDLNGGQGLMQPIHSTNRDAGSSNFWKRSIYHGIHGYMNPSHVDDEGKQRHLMAFIVVRSSILDMLSSLYSAQGLNRVVIYILLNLTILLLLAVLFSSLLGLGINRTITRGVAALREGTESLRKGNLDTKIELKSIDELGDLATGFNKMTRDLRHMVAQMAVKERLEQEIEIARNIQQNLLPQTLPNHDGYDIFGKSEPAQEVGGDYYDAITTPENQIGIAIADVSGKGVAAALLMSNLQAGLRLIARADSSLAEVVQRINLLIYRNSTLETFITFFIGYIDPLTNILRYINAGHDTPAIIRGERTIDLDVGGMMLGAFDTASYEEGSIQLEPGDILVMYTDGFSESKNEEEEEFGRERILSTIRAHHNESAEDIFNAVLDGVSSFSSQLQHAEDDLTMLIVKHT
ncbi:SpoIIE family protein phosphatase [bacterium]|nr:SpoIIE family protein phosphatase [bacterium]